MSFIEKIKASLLEKLAELEHEQWNHWMKYQDKILGKVTDETVAMWYNRQDKWKRWMHLAHTPYAKLTEKEKKSDREWANKVLKVVLNEFKPLMAHLQKFPIENPNAHNYWVVKTIQWKEELDNLPSVEEFQKENVCIKRKRLEKIPKDSFILSGNIHDILLKSGRVKGGGFAKVVDPAVYDYLEKLSKELLGKHEPHARQETT